MANNKIVCLGIGLLSAFPIGALAQNVLTFNTDAGKKTHIAVGSDTLRIGYGSGIATLPIMCQEAVSATATNKDGSTADWMKVLYSQADRVAISYAFSPSTEAREGLLKLTTTDGTSLDVVVLQEPNSAASTIKGDTKLIISTKGTTASAAQSGEGIANSYDGDLSTIYHSPYNGSLPVVLTYTLKEASHVDYLEYTPRTDGGNGGSNGNFGKVLIEYTKSTAPNDWITLADTDFGESSAAQRVEFGENGMDDVAKVRFTVKSGFGGFASCAEMGFYQYNNASNAIIDAFFTDGLCTELKPGVTAEQINNCGNDYFRLLALTLLNGTQTDFQKKFRVGTFEAYETPGTLSARLKTSNYNQYENPTGIYFRKGQPVVVFAKGIGAYGVKLNIHDFGNFDGNNDSSYPLKNGLNVITPSTTGNGYVNYYVAPSNLENAPKIELHFALAEVNGYFDADRGDDNAFWKKILKEGAVSNIMDLRTKRVQVAYPVSVFRANCPANAVELSKLIDGVIYSERQIMGLVRYNEEPRNRQFARIVKSGMFADGIGAAAADPSGWVKPRETDFDFWGFAHEQGHVNQIRPSFRWTGLGETTNNIYSAWAQFSERDASPYLRLESENCNVYNSNGESMGRFTGGRFNCYLQQNVVEGATWQFANGDDYAGQTDVQGTMPDEDEDGNVISGKTFTGPKRNFDHFVKLPPLWQLQLYGTQCGFAPDIYAKVLKGLRGASDTNAKGQAMTCGQQQIRFIKTVCDSTKLNFLPFFEKAGLLKPVKRIIEDYTPALMNISEKMINELKDYVAKAGYPTPEGEINYITGLNWEMYKNKAALVKAGVGEGCTNDGKTVTVNANVWKNAVAFETYDANGKLIAVSMFGLGNSANIKNISKTTVMFPGGAKTIKAVGWNGERAVCFEAN